jgi:hypothetical protein
MTFGSTFGRVISPTFQPKSQAVAGGGWWDLDGTIASCVAAYQPKGAADYAASLTDLSGNSNDAAEGNAPDWDATNGWKFVSANSDYLDSGIVVTSSYTTICRFSNAPDAVQALYGAYDADNNTIRIIPNRNNGYYYYGLSRITGNIANGVMGIAGINGYLNGALDKENCLVSTPDSLTCYIGAQNQSGVAAPFGGYIQAFAIYSAILTETQMGLLTTAMAAL